MRYFFTLCLSLLLLWSCQAPVKQSNSKLIAAQPEAAGFSGERLTRLDSTFTKWVDAGWMNGAVAFIARDGKIVYHKATGYNNLETKEALEVNDIFRIASQTKAITSVAVMMLWEEGKFLLDDPVSKYIPAFADATVLDKFNAKDTTYTTIPAKRQVTVRDLLTHTSGIGYAQIGSPEANAIYAKHNITAGLDVSGDGLEAAMNRLGPLPLMHEPGKQWTYGLNTDLLGRLVEVWSGKTLDEFFSERIFKPLGMNDTYFNLPEDKADRLVNFYQQDSTGLKLQPTVFGALDMSFPLKKKSYFSGGGGLSSTIYDYAIFLQMLLNNGEYNGVRLLARNTVRLMTMNQINDLEFGNDKFGLGFLVVTEKGSAIAPYRAGTYGWGGAFSTTYWVDPEEKLVVLLYRQMWGAHDSEITDIYRILVYQALND
ncbi:MAG: beta-lactamase family protein [Cyclobacteriaceae bacterium]|nr:beta-lactamase family protein [Cyclobacteriaceae bacterium]